MTGAPPKNNAKASPKGRKALVIGGERIRPGESRDLMLKVGESYLGAPVTLPLHVIRAAKPGPRVLLTGAIHGDELNGMGILRQLLYGEPPRLTHGALIIIPVVNVYGLENHTRYLPDRRDLNRMFPGAPNGSLSSRLAHIVFKEVVQKCDYCIDFHTAAVRGTNYPNIRGDLRDPQVRMLARAFGCELIVDGRGPEGSLRRAATHAGVPTIILEAGEVWKIESGVVSVGVRGVNNVLKTLGMMQGEPVAPRFQTKIRKTTWVRAPRSGSISFAANPGDPVAKDQVLATIFSILGGEGEELTAPGYGIVLGVTTMPVAKPGAPIYHMAVVSRPTYQRIKKSVDASSSRYLFSRVSTDLATNVHGVE